MVTSHVSRMVGQPNDVARRALRGTGLFEHVPVPQLDALLARAHVRHFEPESAVLDRHSSPEYLRVLLTGVAKLHATSRDGTEVILRILRPGDVFGEGALLGEAADGSEVSAIQVSCVLSLHRDDIGLLPGQATLYRQLAQVMARRLQSAEAQRASMLSADSQQRIARCLLDLAGCFAQPDHAGRHVAVPVRQRDLAAMAGVARETANRALTMLEVAGAVAMTSRQAVTVDPARLRRWLREA